MKQRDTSQVSHHCVKSVQIWSYFWSVFSPNTGKYGPEITPYLDTSQASSMEPQITNKHNPPKWRTRMTHEFGPRIWPKRMTREFILRFWPMSLIHEFDSREWNTRMTHKFDPREWPTSLTHENETREPRDLVQSLMEIIMEIFNIL